MEDSRAFYTVSGVRWRSTMSTATAGRGVGVTVASFCACGGGDEDDDVLLVLIRDEGVHGLVWAVVWGWTMGCHGQVRCR
jgi:hypothetical protein